MSLDYSEIGKRIARRRKELDTTPMNFWSVHSGTMIPTGRLSLNRSGLLIQKSFR